MTVLDEALDVCRREASSFTSQVAHELVSLPFCQLRFKVEVLQVHLDDARALRLSREVAENGLVDSTRPQESHVDEVWPSSGRHDEDAVAALHTVKITEELVDYSISDGSLIGASLGHQRVKLVEEEDARLLRHGFLKQFAHILLGSTNVLVEQLGTLDTNEVHAEALRNGSGHIRLAAARWTVQHEPLANFLAAAEEQ